MEPKRRGRKPKDIACPRCQCARFWPLKDAVALHLSGPEAVGPVVRCMGCAAEYWFEGGTLHRVGERVQAKPDQPQPRRQPVEREAFNPLDGARLAPPEPPQ